MSLSCWSSDSFKDPRHVLKLHNPRVYARAFDLKVPQTFCAYEDCVYKKEASCPAGALKEQCPNKSSLDYPKGCGFYYGKPYQYFVLRDSMSGQFNKIVTITGRGTGKSAVMDTQKTLMEITTEPYVRSYLFKCDRPVPTKVIVVGNTKDTALLLRRSIRNTIEGNELLDSFVVDKTATYIRTITESEVFFRTAGVDGRGIRGFHADIIKNVLRQDIKCTIIIIFDEACFTRAKQVISEVMMPSLQVGNTFSQVFITSTPYGKSGETYDLYNTTVKSGEKDDTVRFNFASYHNRYTNLRILRSARRRLEKAGMGSIYNREVKGQFESEEGLFFPWFVWAKSLDDSLDWFEYEKIEEFAGKVSGQHYLAVDPNKFRQLEHGDFAAYHLMTVTSDRSHIRSISYGKYLMDIEDKFTKRIKRIVEVFDPVVSCDENSGYMSRLSEEGIDVRPAKNRRVPILTSMGLCKIDMVNGIYKQPSSQDWEDERRSFVPKEDDLSNIPLLDHAGEWGSGFSSDLMRCLSYNYQMLMDDFGIYDLDYEIRVGEPDQMVQDFGKTYMKTKGGIYSQLTESSVNRMRRIK